MRWWISFALLSSAGCLDLGAFPCTSDEQCRLDGQAGVCAPPGYCALPDASCGSGFSFHERSPPELVGQCVDEAGETTLDPVTTSTSTSSTTSIPPDLPGGTTSSTTTPVGESEGSTGFRCGDRPCPCAVEIAAGEEHTCVLRDDGSVVCWGENTNGELGTGEVGAPSPWPLSAVLPPGVTGSGLSMGNHITCVTGSDGELYCWGRNTFGEIVPSQIGTPVATPTAVDWVPTGGAYGLSPRHACIAAADGSTLACFGENLRGQLGSMDMGPGPHTVADPMMLLPPIDEVSAGRQHTCARSGGSVACWGADMGGALGNDVPFEDIAAPEAVLIDAAAVKISSGREHVCAILEGGVRMQCWGSNLAGQLAVGPAGPAAAAAPLEALEEFDAPVEQFVSRLDSSCVMTQSGALRCWGSNGDDKYGTGNAFESVPVAVAAIDELSEPPVAVGLGDFHMCVISDGGYVWCWGADNVEQIGPLDPMPGETAVELNMRCED